MLGSSNEAICGIGLLSLIPSLCGGRTDIRSRRATRRDVRIENNLATRRTNERVAAGMKCAPGRPDLTGGCVGLRRADWWHPGRIASNRPHWPRRIAKSIGRADGLDYTGVRYIGNSKPQLIRYNKNNTCRTKVADQTTRSEYADNAGSIYWSYRSNVTNRRPNSSGYRNEILDGVCRTIGHQEMIKLPYMCGVEFYGG